MAIGRLSGAMSARPDYLAVVVRVRERRLIVRKGWAVDSFAAFGAMVSRSVEIC